MLRRLGRIARRGALRLMRRGVCGGMLPGGRCGLCLLGRGRGLWRWRLARWGSWRSFGLRHSAGRAMGGRAALQRDGRLAMMFCRRRALHLLGRIGRLAVRR